MHKKNRDYIGTVQSEQKVASRVAIHKVDNVKSIIEAVYVITCKAIKEFAIFYLAYLVFCQLLKIYAK